MAKKVIAKQAMKALDGKSIADVTVLCVAILLIIHFVTSNCELLWRYKIPVVSPVVSLVVNHD